MSLEFLAPFYLWLKWLHISAVMAWMAGLFYLPRLFVHHAERGAPGSDLSETFKMMELKLFKLIMTPAMIAAWAFGLLLASTPQIGWGGGWLHAKIFFVLVLSGFHGACGRWRRDFAEDKNTRSGRFYRLMNEAPTLLMLAILALVVFKPWQ